MHDVDKLAEQAEVIVSGYAINRVEEGARIVNLKQPDHVAVISRENEVLMTSMDDIELHIVSKYLENSWKYMEDSDAEVL